MLLPAAGSYRNLRRRRCTGELTPACCQQNASPGPARLRHRWPVVTAVAWHHFMLAPLPRGHLNPYTIRPLQAPPTGDRFHTAKAPYFVAKPQCWDGCMREALRPASPRLPHHIYGVVGNLGGVSYRLPGYLPLWARRPSPPEEAPRLWSLRYPVLPLRFRLSRWTSFLFLTTYYHIQT